MAHQKSVVIGTMSDIIRVRNAVHVVVLVKEQENFPLITHHNLCIEGIILGPTPFIGVIVGIKGHY